MKPSWAKISELLEAALDLSGEKRVDFLQEVCGGDEELFVEIESLLAADQAAGAFFAQPLVAARRIAPPWLTSEAPTLVKRSGAKSRREISHRPRAAACLPPGTVLAGRYRVVSLLGQGEIYRADDLRLALPVNLEFLPPALASDGDGRARFLAEAHLARKVSHPNVCRVYEVGEIDGIPFLSMEDVDGQDLASLLQRAGQLAPEKVAEMAGQLAEGLAAIHQQGFLRLLEPSRILLDECGRVRIAHLGIASRYGGTGDPAYTAPEVLAGDEPTEKSDLYALGLVLYEIAAGELPLAAASVDELWAVRGELLPVSLHERAPSLDTNVETIILRCLEPDPAARPASSRVVAAAVCPAVQNQRTLETAGSGEKKRPLDWQAPSWQWVSGQSLPRRPHWVLERNLEIGELGELWLARHSKTAERRMLKIATGASQRQALEREIALFCWLKEQIGERDDIARILDWHVDLAPCFLEAEYTAGGDLHEWAKQQGDIAKVGLDERLEIILRVAVALAALHAVGFVHRSIEPSSILILQYAGGLRIRLAGLGLGVVPEHDHLGSADSLISSLIEPVGGPLPGARRDRRLYMAPELLEGQPATPQSDVYALGTLFYQMIVGDLGRALAPGWQRDISDVLLAEAVEVLIDRDPQRRLSAADLAERLRSHEKRRVTAERDRQERLEHAHEADGQTGGWRWWLAVVARFPRRSGG